MGACNEKLDKIRWEAEEPILYNAPWVRALKSEIQ